MLYDVRMPKGLHKSVYEEVFADVLKLNPNVKEIKKYILRNNLSKHLLKRIRKTCFIEGVFYKFPKEIPVFVEGKEPHSRYGNLSLIISRINELTDDINLEIKTEPKSYNGIHINFLEKEKLIFSSSMSSLLFKGKGIRPVRTKAIIEINPLEEFRLYELKKLGNKIFENLGPLYEKQSIFNDNMTISYPFTKLIGFLYSDLIPDGMTIDEYDEILEEIEEERLLVDNHLRKQFPTVVN